MERQGGSNRDAGKYRVRAEEGTRERGDGGRGRSYGQHWEPAPPGALRASVSPSLPGYSDSPPPLRAPVGEGSCEVQGGRVVGTHAGSWARALPATTPFTQPRAPTAISRHSLLCQAHVSAVTQKARPHPPEQVTVASPDSHNPRPGSGCPEGAPARAWGSGRISQRNAHLTQPGGGGDGQETGSEVRI